MINMSAAAAPAQAIHSRLRVIAVSISIMRAVLLVIRAYQPQPHQPQPQQPQHQQPHQPQPPPPQHQPQRHRRGGHLL